MNGPATSWDESSWSCILWNMVILWWGIQILISICRRLASCGRGKTSSSRGGRRWGTWSCLLASRTVLSIRWVRWWTWVVQKGSVWLVSRGADDGLSCRCPPRCAVATCRPLWLFSRCCALRRICVIIPILLKTLSQSRVDFLSYDYKKERSGEELTAL